MPKNDVAKLSGMNKNATTESLECSQDAFASKFGQLA